MMTTSTRNTANRLDNELLLRGLAPSRTKAQGSVESGLVRVNGKIVLKANKVVLAEDEISVESEPQDVWVSRAALKLIAALEAFAVVVEGKNALDLGASTGGFTQVLLARGAAHVTAVDVGHGQLAQEISAHPDVTVLERLNVKDLTAEHLAYAPELITADLSFISLKKALPAALGLAQPGASLVALIKPQFEVGRAGVGKGGIVKDEALVAEVLREVPEWLAREHGAVVQGPVASPIKGGDGNQEYLVHAVLQ